jgi:hypothetical protein
MVSYDVKSALGERPVLRLTRPSGLARMRQVTVAYQSFWCLLELSSHGEFDEDYTFSISFN